MSMEPWVAIWLVKTLMVGAVLVFLPLYSAVTWVLFGASKHWAERYPVLANEPYTTRAGRWADAKRRGFGVTVVAAFGFWAMVTVIMYMSDAANAALYG